jgi:hypothetical protein
MPKPAGVTYYPTGLGDLEVMSTRVMSALLSAHRARNCVMATVASLGVWHPVACIKVIGRSVEVLEHNLDNLY